jgi:hypothetical protein
LDQRPTGQIRDGGDPNVDGADVEVQVGEATQRVARV